MPNTSPENIEITAKGKGVLTGEIEVMEHLGSDSYAYVGIKISG